MLCDATWPIDFSRTPAQLFNAEAEQRKISVLSHLEVNFYANTKLKTLQRTQKYLKYRLTSVQQHNGKCICIIVNRRTVMMCVAKRSLAVRISIAQSPPYYMTNKAAATSAPAPHYSLWHYRDYRLH